tara:strand:+ start:3379 stop:3774 length:396 start_codon:yes stop_codon:yes gene_type:complete
MKKSLKYKICYLKLKGTGKNIYLTLTNSDGNVILKLSSGMIKKTLGLTFFKKYTIFASQQLLIEFNKLLIKKKIYIKLVILKIEGFFNYGPIRKMVEELSYRVYFLNVALIQLYRRTPHGSMKKKKNKTSK